MLRRYRKEAAAMKDYQEFDINYFQDEDGLFTAVVPAIKGCIASGKTLEEAYRNAVDAIESCLEARQKVAATKLRKAKYSGLNIYRKPLNA
jgi:predicted RNase H-like HicB family nuclease